MASLATQSRPQRSLTDGRQPPRNSGQRQPDTPGLAPGSSPLLLPEVVDNRLQRGDDLRPIDVSFSEFEIEVEGLGRWSVLKHEGLWPSCLWLGRGLPSNLSGDLARLGLA